MKNKLMSWEESVQWLRAQSDQNDLVRACYYDDPLEECVERFYFSTEWQAVQDILGCVERGNALDVGAGRGISSYALARDGWCVTALEPDFSSIVGSGAIKQMAWKGLDITVVEEYGETLPFANNSFELVYGRAVLHHADNLKKFCQEIHRVLKPGGMLIATREHVISRRRDLQAFFDNHPLHHLYGGENAFLLGEYLEALRDPGLKVNNILAPFDSDINLFPSSMKGVRAELARKLGLVIPEWIFINIVIPMLNHVEKKPGRLFSFITRKP